MKCENKANRQIKSAFIHSFGKLVPSVHHVPGIALDPEHTDENERNHPCPRSLRTADLERANFIFPSEAG